MISVYGLRRLPPGLRDWLAHHNVGVTIGNLAVLAVVYLFVILDKVRPEIALLPVLLTYGSSGYLRRFHSRSWTCDRCVLRRCGIDGALVAPAHYRALRAYHRWVRPRFTAGMCVLLTIPGVVGSYLGSTPVHMVGFITLTAALVSEAVISNRHDLLSPWCPWCRHRGRGPRTEPVVTPMPIQSPREPVVL